MRKKNPEPVQSKEMIHCANNAMKNLSFGGSDSEIRIGIKMAEEKAKEESLKRKIEAPLTIEEKILSK